MLSPKRPRDGRHIVLYDGLCGLCDRSVRFLLRADRAGVLHYAPLQGPTAAALRRRLRVPDTLDSLLFVRDAGSERETLLVRSSGVLAALDAIGGLWRVVSWLRVVPRPVRDAVYDFIARRRTRWFGRLEACRVPDPETRERFLE